MQWLSKNADIGKERGEDMEKVIIVATVRTPVGIFDGKLKGISEQELGALVMLEVLERSGLDPETIDEVILGTAKQTSTPSNCARHAVLKAKLPVSIPAYTVHRQSASGIQAIANAFWAIRSKDAKAIIAGGTESMSQIPREIHNARFSFNESTQIIFDPIAAQISCAQPVQRYGMQTMESLAQNIAQEYGITEQEAAAYTMKSAEKSRAYTAGEEILMVNVKKGKSMETVTQDELYKDICMVARPADGAAVSVLMSHSVANDTGVIKLAELVSVGISAGSPIAAGLIGAEAIRIALLKAGMVIHDIDLIGLNEMSAAQSIAVCRELIKLGMSEQDVEKKVNANGGTLSTGNPWGASGAMLITRMVYELQATCAKTGLVVVPAEGGQTMAMVLTKL